MVDDSLDKIDIKKYRNKLIIISGATATGKSDLAMNIARSLDGEIIGADTIQMYRGFDIGAAKPSDSDRYEIPHHMIDILDWNQNYDAGAYAKKVRSIILDIKDRGKTPILAGGSGLYIRAVMGKGFNLDISSSDENFREKMSKISEKDLYILLSYLDEKRANCIHPNDRYRIQRAIEIMHLTGKKVSELETKALNDEFDIDRFWIYLKPSREEIVSNIEKRVDIMMEEGLIEEVKNLLDSGCDPESKPMQSIGYKEVVEGILNNDMDSIRENIIISTRQYAKRQTTWFNKVKYDCVIQSKDQIIL